VETLPTETIPLAEGFSLSDVPEYSGSPMSRSTGIRRFSPITQAKPLSSTARLMSWGAAVQRMRQSAKN
ncbi:MAG: hypothetical protein IKN55_07235, partial [Oscillospiraceae bacterium]|nr:hypothetical protein [Oscillospiraceae bacterium]